MPYYPENKIREAMRTIWNSGSFTIGGIYAFEESVIAELKKDSHHHHDFADHDTITVKEIRESWKRLCYGTIADVNTLLRDISTHREPEHPHGSVWKDRNGAIWFRSGNTWLKPGDSLVYTDTRPLRPLQRMDVI